MQTLKLPKSGQAMEEGTIVKWHVDEGDTVSEGDPVVEFESDKTTVEIPAGEDGQLLRRTVPIGETVSIGTTLGYIGTDESELPEEEASAGDDTGKTATETTGDAGTDESTATETLSIKQVRGSPQARRVAREHDIDVAEVGQALGVQQVRATDIEAYLDEQGGSTSGANGETDVLGSPLARRVAEEENLRIQTVAETVGKDRIRIADVEAYLDEHEVAESEVNEPDRVEHDGESATGVVGGEPQVAEELPIEGTRQVMFDRMSKVTQEYASTTTVARVDVTDLWGLRDRLSPVWTDIHDIKPSLTAFVVGAVAESLPDYGILNAAIDAEGESVTMYDDINVGIAVNTDRGLLVPTIYGADEQSVRELSSEIARLAAGAEENTLEYDDLQNGTFTVSNAGNLGAYINTPQINPPQTAILGVCTVFDQPDIVDGEIEPRKKMHLCLTYDHRVVEGATAVSFLQSVKDLMETPEALLS